MPHHEDVSEEPIDSRNDTSHSTSTQNMGMQNTRQGRLRPRSLYQPGSVQQVIRVEGDTTTYSQPVRPTDTSMKPPLSAGLHRSQSLRRPGAPASAAQPPSRSHTRTQSTTTARKPSNEDKSRSERPRSLMVAPGRVTKPIGDPPSNVTAGSARTSARLEALKRSTSTRVRPEASNGRPTAVVAHVSGSDKILAQTGHRETVEDEPRKLARPAFSTLQQHFTPRKTAKASTSAFLHPSPDTSFQSLPPEAITLQSELLQLHLLHESSAWTNKRWELSAKQSLRNKFDEVASLYEVMRETERLGQEQKNLLAFREWNGANVTSGLVEHIQALSGPLHELPSLTEYGSRLNRLVDDFDGWLSKVEQVWVARHSLRGERTDSKSLGGLGDAWEEQNAALTRKLTAFLRHLDSLPPPAHGSSIASVVYACKQLLDGLLFELQIMKTIEAGVVAKERHWIEERLRVIAQDGVSPVVSSQDKAWRV
jgi:hypothetical protein